MNKWLLYLLIVLEVGGGFMGLSVTLDLQPWNKNANIYHWSVFIGICFLFSFGIIAGLALVKESKCGIVLSTIYQAFQIPLVSSSIISYQFLSGIRLVVGVFRIAPFLMFNLGASININAGIQADWGFGVNLLALALFVYLLYILFIKFNFVESNLISENFPHK